MKIISQVIKGKGLGKQLGFPTLNFELENKDISGVFSGSIELNKEKYKAAIFIGKPKTLNEDKRSFETHLFDFNKTVEVDTKAVIKIGTKIRDIKKFENLEELKKAIAKDCEKIKKM